MGDILLTTPLLKKIKSEYPGTCIEFLTLDEFSELLRYNPYIDTLHLISRDLSIAQLISKAHELSERGYRYLFDLHRSTRSLIFRLLVKAAKKSRLNKRYIKRFLLVSFKINLYRKPFSVVNRYFACTEILNLIPDNGAELWISRNEMKMALNRICKLININPKLKYQANGDTVRIERELIKRESDNRFISIMPFATWKTKEWETSGFIEAGMRLSGKTDTLILVLGGKEDQFRAEEIADSIGKNAVSLAGKTTMLESSVIISLSECLITNDTGLMHFGGAVKTPVVSIFGSTTEELGFFPYRTEGEIIQAGLKCRPCTAKGRHDCPRDHFKCMKDISVEQVCSAVLKYMK